jgi:hypothetical protein
VIHPLRTQLGTRDTFLIADKGGDYVSEEQAPLVIFLSILVALLVVIVMAYVRSSKKKPDVAAREKDTRNALMRRRLIWVLGMAFAYWLMFSKGGYDSAIEAVSVAIAGGVIGLGLAYASSRPRNINDARLKIAYWPLALVLFVTYPVVGIWWDNREWGTGWIWKPFSIAVGIGLLFGISHWLTTSRKL